MTRPTTTPPPAAPADAPPPVDSPLLGDQRSRLRWSALPEWSGALVALLVMVAIVSVFNPVFLTPTNLLNVLHSWSFRGIIAIGMTFVILQGGIDLSVGSLVAFTGVLGLWVMRAVIAAEAVLADPGAHGRIHLALAQAATALGIADSEVAGVLVAAGVILLAATLAGAFNGLLIARARIAPFIVTLGGLAAYRSLGQAIANGGEIRSTSLTILPSLGRDGIPLPFLTNPYGRALMLPWPVLTFALVAVAAWVLLTLTRYGRYVYAVGSNEEAARYSAVRVERVRLLTYTLLGGLTGLAAFLSAARLNSVSSGQAAVMWELDVIAAVVIGGTRMNGGSGTIIGTVIGLLILSVIDNMLGLMNISPHLTGLVKGAVILAAVLLHRGRRTTT